MMLVHSCSPRVFLVLVALLLAASLLTAFRRQSGLGAARPLYPYLGSEQGKALGHGQHSDDTTRNTPLLNTVGEVTEKCSNPELDLLRRPDLGLTESILYTRRCIKAIPGKSDRDVVSNITGPLITGTTAFNLTADCSTVRLPRCEQLTLHVPPPYPQAQYRHLLFGVASSYERIRSSLPVFAHWIAGTGARLVLVVSDAELPQTEPLNLSALQEEYHNAGIQAIIIPPTIREAIPHKDADHAQSAHHPAPVEQLHFLLIRDMLAVATQETQWLGILDDDTFFPALYPLDQELRRHNHTRPTWLGTLADSFSSIRVWGYMAYGGAGIFLSVPLARQLEPHLEACIRETTGVVGGDGMLRDCIYAHTTTKLTLIEGLYQHDIMGDPSGFFESGRRALSLHHWKSWYHAPVAAMATITRLCGACFLQRFRFTGDDTLLANGYSITQYSPPGLLDTLDLSRVEGTWEHAFDDDDHDKDKDNDSNSNSSDFDFVYGPLRKALSEREKKSWRLVTAAPVVTAAAGGGGADNRDGHDHDHGKASNPKKLRQLYVHRARRGGEREPVDEVIELVWEV